MEFLYRETWYCLVSIWPVAPSLRRGFRLLLGNRFALRSRRPHVSRFVATTLFDRETLDAKRNVIHVSNNKEFGLSANEPNARQQLAWKGAIMLLCVVGIFALVMGSGTREPSQRCTEGESAAREACMSDLRAQAPRPLAKGGVAPTLSGVVEHRAIWLADPDSSHR
jgi:hypothetical protein